MTQWHDPVVEEVRHIREQQAAELNYDLKARLNVPADNRSSPSARRYRLPASWCLIIIKRERKPGEWAGKRYRILSSIATA